MDDNQTEQAQPNDGPSYAPSIKTVTIKIDDIPIVRIMLLTEFSPRIAKMHLIAQVAKAMKSKAFEAVLAQMGFK
jgi:hypothetical protein